MQTDTPGTPVRDGGVTSYGRRAAPWRPAVIRYAGRHVGFLAGLLIAAIALGIAYRYLFDPFEQRTLPYYIRSAVHAIGLAFSGWAVHLAFAALPPSRLGGVLRRLPLSAEFAVKALTMTAVLTTVAVGLEFVLYPSALSRYWLADQLPLIVGIAFSVSLFVGAIFELRRMIGGRVLGSFLLGTYHRPRREQRIVTFLDIADSTAVAEQLGELRVHDLITRFFFDIDQPIAEQDGEVHAYVGDEVIVTWPLTEDPERNARSLRCFFAIEERMIEPVPSYAEEFGIVPRFRAGIHSGPVVVSECGGAKRQIAYFGDTMNVAARLCEHCKVAGEALVISADLLRSAAVPHGLSLGRHASLMLRGRRTPVEAHAVHLIDPSGKRLTSRSPSIRYLRSIELLESCSAKPEDSMSASHLQTLRAMAYNNAWANHRLLTACARLTQAEFEAPRTGFFPSIQATLNHILVIDRFYVDALEGGTLGPAAWADPVPCPTVSELGPAQAAVDRRLIAWCEALDEAGVDRIIHVHRGTRVQTERADRLLLHLFQHQIHHRGHAHAMLSSTPVAPPQLDEFFSIGEAPLRAAEFDELGWSEASIWRE